MLARRHARLSLTSFRVRTSQYPTRTFQCPVRSTNLYVTHRQFRHVPGRLSYSSPVKFILTHSRLYDLRLLRQAILLACERPWRAKLTGTLYFWMRAASPGLVAVLTRWPRARVRAISWISGVPCMRMGVLYRYHMALQRLVLYVNGGLFLMLMSTQAHCTHTTTLTNKICSVSGSRCKPGSI